MPHKSPASVHLRKKGTVMNNWEVELVPFRTGNRLVNTLRGREDAMKLPGGDLHLSQAGDKHGVRVVFEPDTKQGIGFEVAWCTCLMCQSLVSLVHTYLG